jgi:hypothetical protein
VYGLNREGKIFDKIPYEVDSSEARRVAFANEAHRKHAYAFYFKYYYE